MCRCERHQQESNAFEHITEHDIKITSDVAKCTLVFRFNLHLNGNTIPGKLTIERTDKDGGDTFRYKTFKIEYDTRVPLDVDNDTLIDMILNNSGEETEIIMS